MSDDVNTRLSRWSQRKLAARRGVALDESETDKQPVAAAPPPAADAAPPESDEAPVLPPIDELTVDSDFTVFLQKNVPEAIKNAALRKLWRSDPVFAVLDGLNDYDEDYNVVDTLITTAQTSYQVGKGYVDEVEETLAKLDPANNDKLPEAEAPARVESPDASAGEARAADLESEPSNSDAPGGDADAAPRQPVTARADDDPGGQVIPKDN